MTQIKHPWHIAGKWCVSPYTYMHDVQKQMPNLPKRVYIRDATLREGDATVGVNFTLENRVEISRRLADIGVKEIDVGRIAADKDQWDACKAIDEAGIRIVKAAHVRARAKDIEEEVDTCMKAGADNIKISGWAFSDFMLQIWRASKQPELSLEEYISKVTKAIKYIHKKYDVEAVAGPVDATRMDLKTLKKAFKAIIDAGVDRVWVADSMGCCTPPGMKFLVGKIKEMAGDIPIHVHCHNDLALATANSIAAVEAGAEWVECCPIGLGVHGNTPLEELVCGLEMLYGVDTGIKLNGLYKLSKFIAKTTGVGIHPLRPIIGEYYFVDQAEPEVATVLKARQLGMDRTWEALESFRPEVVGREEHKVVWGVATKGFYGSIVNKLDLLGLKYTEKDVQKIRERISEEVITKKKKYVSEDEFDIIAKEIIKA